jgi:hypothetical protein
MPSYVRAVVIFVILRNQGFRLPWFPAETAGLFVWGLEGPYYAAVGKTVAIASFDSLVHKSAHTHIHHDAQRQKNEQY